MSAIGTKFASELIRAINDEAADKVRELLAAGADANSFSDNCTGTTKMVVLVQRKEMHIGPPKRKTALQIASHLGNEDIVSQLIAAGAHVNMPDELGWTSLMFACYARAEKIVKLLVEHGAYTDDEHEAGNPDACALGMLGLNNADLTEFLLGYPQPKQTLQKVLYNAVYYRKAGVTGYDSEAAERITALALDAGADPNGAFSGWRPLDRAIDMGSMAVTQLLLQKGASIEGQAGRSAMSYACGKQYGQDFVRLLTTLGLVVHEKDLDMAIRTGQDDVILAALENITLNGVDYRQMRMESASHVSVVEALIKAGDCPKSARHLFEVMGEDLYQKSRSGASLLRLCKPQTRQVVLSLRAGETIVGAMDGVKVASQNVSKPKNEVGML